MNQQRAPARGYSQSWVMEPNGRIVPTGRATRIALAALTTWWSRVWRLKRW
jgi:hypothetical protein